MMNGNSNPSRRTILTKINSLVEDIYSLFDPKTPHTANEDNLEAFAENIKELMRTRLAKREHSTSLRFSSLGRGDRFLWYVNQGNQPDEMSSKTYVKFLYGDLIEQLLLFLAKESGHEVTHEQEEVNVDGILGHIDAIIDGTVVDIKSASPFGYKKFENNSLTEDDPFGYIPQICGYSNVLTPGKGPAFLAFDKVSADICLAEISSSIADDFQPEPRIAHLKEIFKKEEPPVRCYSDEEDGKSGNRKLGTSCSYCGFKKECWKDSNNGQGLRTFLYSSGPKYLTNVVRTPDVYELKE